MAAGEAMRTRATTPALALIGFVVILLGVLETLWLKGW